MGLRTLIGVLVAVAMLALAAGPPDTAPRAHRHPPQDRYTHMPTPFSARL
jgi:hypothetical protein